MRATCKKQTVGYTGIMLWCQNSNLLIDFLACCYRRKWKPIWWKQISQKKKYINLIEKKTLQVKLSTFCNTTSKKQKACKLILTVIGKEFYGDYHLMPNSGQRITHIFFDNNNNNKLLL